MDVKDLAYENYRDERYSDMINEKHEHEESIRD